MPPEQYRYNIYRRIGDPLSTEITDYLAYNDTGTEDFMAANDTGTEDFLEAND